MRRIKEGEKEMTTTDTFAVLVVGGKYYHMFLNGGTDGAETEIKVEDISGALRSLGEMLQDNVLTDVEVQCSDGSILSTFKIYDSQGGVVLSVVGNERTTWAKANFEMHGLQIPIHFGMVAKVNTGD